MIIAIPVACHYRKMVKWVAKGENLERKRTRNGASTVVKVQIRFIGFILLGVGTQRSLSPRPPEDEMAVGWLTHDVNQTQFEAGNFKHNDLAEPTAH
jgi:hypothetical protein